MPAKHDEIEKYKIISGRFLLKLGNNKESIITSLRGLKPNSICSASFAPLFISSSQVEAYNAYRYIKSKFFRFLVMLMIDNGRTGVSKARFELVPDQDFTNKSDIDWDKDIDNQLYKKYGLTQEEINHIENEICALD